MPDRKHISQRFLKYPPPPPTLHPHPKASGDAISCILWGNINWGNYWIEIAPGFTGFPTVTKDSWRVAHPNKSSFFGIYACTLGVRGYGYQVRCSALVNAQFQSWVCIVHLWSITVALCPMIGFWWWWWLFFYLFSTPLDCFLFSPMQLFANFMAA